LLPVCLRVVDSNKFTSWYNHTKLELDRGLLLNVPVQTLYSLNYYCCLRVHHLI
jgi:hypothetical protein